MNVITSSSAEETMALGEKLAAYAQANDVIVLNGDLGAGKTHFSKGFARGLGVADDVCSPTFNIMIEYEGNELPLFHFDLYRLDDEQELDDIDFFGMLESDGVSLVEWGDKFPSEMPDEYLEVSIRVGEGGERRIVATPHGVRGQELAQVLGA